jgi:hypothetical protein|tara:strand:+ start:1210 stop:2133 length:924 start_codon:yes stop_codon:yes gene_type:complete
MSFANLKRNRDQISNLLQAAEAVGGSTEKKSYTDERMWKPTVDKAGNGYAVIRFLPAGEGQDVPWARYWDHGFKGPQGQWYIEKSLTSIGLNDPVGEMNSLLWNSGIEADKDKARTQKRRLHYVSNILVVSDPGNPANEGKIFMYQYGKKIFDKIMDMMQPQFQDEEPVNPFDMWEGANFKLKIRQVEGYRNYDKSEFASLSALADNDEKLESLYNQMHDLSEWTDPKNYKTYDELKTKLNSILGMSAPQTVAAAVSLDEVARPNEPAAVLNPHIPQEPREPVTAEQVSEEGEEDTMSYFARLANAD